MKDIVSDFHQQNEAAGKEKEEIDDTASAVAKPSSHESRQSSSPYEQSMMKTEYANYVSSSSSYMTAATAVSIESMLPSDKNQISVLTNEDYYLTRILVDLRPDLPKIDLDSLLDQFSYNHN